MHLVKCGYPKIIYIGVPREEKDGYPRYEAVKNGAGSVPVHYVLSDDTLVSGASVARSILKKFKPPFGVIGHNDLVAIGAMHEFLAQKIKIPHEIGIVGYDNIAMSEFVSPSLTTVSQQQSTFGTHVMSLLEQLFNGEKKCEKYFNHTKTYRTILNYSPVKEKDTMTMYSKELNPIDVQWLKETVSRIHVTNRQIGKADWCGYTYDFTCPSHVTYPSNGFGIHVFTQ